jgi:hypothetical protein
MAEKVSCTERRQVHRRQHTTEEQRKLKEYSNEDGGGNRFRQPHTQEEQPPMSRDSRRTLVPTLVIVAVIFFATGLAGHIAHKLDFTATLLLMFGFAVFSIGITWLQLWDDRQTRTRLLRIAAQLAPYNLDISVCKGGTYEVMSQGALCEDIVSEALDLDELEAFIAGLHHGVVFAHTGHDDSAMEARIARQEAQYSEDRAHSGIDSSYIWRIPGMED